MSQTLEDLQMRQAHARLLRQASRSKFQRINSLELIPEDPSQSESDELTEQQQHQHQEQYQRQQEQFRVLRRQRTADGRLLRSSGSLMVQSSESSDRLISTRLQKVLLFWPQLLLNVLFTLLRYVLFIPLSIAAPSFWLSALLWIFWKIIRVPVGIVKWLVNGNGAAAAGVRQRTVLISCGSTIQTLHLARNFYASGSRVVVFEFEGLFSLARFSTAVDKFYVVPRPTTTNVEQYIAALCHIVAKERPTVYIPVCATNAAYYDALAKPHLELLGCASFIPSVQETVQLDDCLQLYQRCAAAQNIPLPPHTVLSAPEDLHQLYDQGLIGGYRNIMMAVGMHGVLERHKYVLPNRRADLKFQQQHEISERQQWMVVRDQPGYNHYVTCTTVKDSRVVANVTCKVDHHSKNLIPLRRNPRQSAAAAAADDEAQIDMWLRAFFVKVRFQRAINGHISFRLVKSPMHNGQFVPLGVRLGVSLPYICYNRSHAQVLCRPKADEATLAAIGQNGLSWSTLERTTTTAALDKREALFAYWDPLPYCAYYHFQLPLESVKMFLQRRNRTAVTATKTLSPRITVPVH